MIVCINLQGFFLSFGVKVHGLNWENLSTKFCNVGNYSNFHEIFTKM